MKIVLENHTWVNCTFFPHHLMSIGPKYQFSLSLISNHWHRPWKSHISGPLPHKTAGDLFCPCLLSYGMIWYITICHICITYLQFQKNVIAKNTNNYKEKVQYSFVEFVLYWSQTVIFRRHMTCLCCSWYFVSHIKCLKYHSPSVLGGHVALVNLQLRCLIGVGKRTQSGTCSWIGLWFTTQPRRPTGRPKS